jgi:hypothetical protein
VNAIAEKNPETGEWEVEKRIGFTTAPMNPGPLAGGIGRGMYSNYIASPIAGASEEAISIIGNGTTAWGYLNGTQLPGGGIPDSPGNWNFTEVQGPTRYLVFTSPGNPNIINRNELYTLVGTTITIIATGLSRGLFIAGVATLDSTVYFMDENCSIYGSNLNDPTTWSALNVVNAQNVAGWGVGLVRQLSYIIALKTASMEVFYDAGNPTGSPLSPIAGATNAYGCVAHDLIQVIDDILLYPSSNLSAAMQIVRVDNLTPSVISTPAIEKLLTPWLASASPSFTAYPFFSFVFKHFGHRFYGITNTIANLTLVYDIDQNLWYQWTDPNGNYFPMSGTCVNANFQHQFVSQANGQIYAFDSCYTYPTDNGVIAPVDIYTPTTDFGTRRGKTLHRMYVRADQQNGSTLYCRHSDDDMQSWSNFRKLDLSKVEPYLDGEGSFKKRSYHYRHASATSLRCRSADLQMDFGVI